MDCFRGIQHTWEIFVICQISATEEIKKRESYTVFIHIDEFIFQ